MVKRSSRSRCNGEKTPLKKGAWSAEEDRKLIDYIKRYKIWNWTEMSKAAGLARSGKSCRLRWVNYLRPDIKHGNFNEEEIETIMAMHETLGNRWSTIAANLPGRTDNEVKNYWHTHLKKLQQPSSSTTRTVLATNSQAAKSSHNVDEEAYPKNLSESEKPSLGPEESSNKLEGFSNITILESLPQPMSTDNFSLFPSRVISTSAQTNCEIVYDFQSQNVNNESITVGTSETFEHPQSSWTQQQPIGNGDSKAAVFDVDPLMGPSTSDAMWQQDSLWTYDLYEDLCHDWLDYMDPIF